MARDRSFPPAILHWSELKHMGRSPAHFRVAYTEPRESTPAMRLGWLVHHLVLGGAGFVVYEGDRRGNAWKDFKAANAGKEIFTADEVSDATRVASAVLSDPLAAPLLVGLREQPISWTGVLGRRFAGTLDVIGEHGITELKTTADANPERFHWQARRMGYHAQLSLYEDGARSQGHRVPRAVIVAVETKPPFAVTVFDVTPQLREEGRKMIRLWVERVVQCEETGVWPAYAQSPVPMDVLEAPTTLIIDGEEVAA